jgi:small subunit ribosomal protein S17
MKMNEVKQTQTKASLTEVGKVIKDKMNKTIVVLITRYVSHPKYKKYIKRNTKLYAHDENNESKEGDIVRITNSRPLSKTKNWQLMEVVEKAKE